MKIKLFSFLLLLVLVQVGYTATGALSEREKLAWYKKSMVEPPQSHLYTAEDVVELVHAYVPHKYIKAFLQYSKMELDYQTNILRVYLLGLGAFESGWIRTRSFKANNNGTHDWGYLMLNDVNIASPSFMRRYGPKADFECADKLELWLITCIQYFKELYLKYGCDGFYAYNAGEQGYLRNKLPTSTYMYKYMVKKNIDLATKRLYDIASTNRILREAADRERQQRFITGELARFAELLRLFSSESRYAQRIENFENGRYEHIINYDPKKKFIAAIHLRTVIFLSLRNDAAMDNALQNV
jgi:hypothetical protein